MSVSKKVAKIVSVGKTKLGQYDAIQIQHTQPDAEDPSRIVKTNVFANQLENNKDLAVKIKNLSQGETVGFIKTQVGRNYQLTDIVAAGEIPKATQRKTWNNSGGGKAKGFNEAAPKVGGILHDAVALAIATKKEGATIQDVESLAEDLLCVSASLEENWNKGKYKPEPEVQSKSPASMADSVDDIFGADDLFG